MCFWFVTGKRKREIGLVIPAKITWKKCKNLQLLNLTKEKLYRMFPINWEKLLCLARGLFKRFWTLIRVNTVSPQIIILRIHVIQGYRYLNSQFLNYFKHNRI